MNGYNYLELLNTRQSVILLQIDFTSASHTYAIIVK